VRGFGQEFWYGLDHADDLEMALEAIPIASEFDKRFFPYRLPHLGNANVEGGLVASFA
jgi:hypothetical protein